MLSKVIIGKWLRRLWSLRQPDTKIAAGWDVIFFGACAYSLRKDGKLYTRPIDPIIEDLEARGLRCLSISLLLADIDVERTYHPTARINWRMLFPLVFDSVFKTNLERSAYRKIIKRSGAKYVFMLNNRKNLVLAAGDLGLMAVEPMHALGVYSNPVPLKWGVRAKGEVPNYILSNDDVSTETLLPLESIGAKIRQIEEPLLKRFLIPRYRKVLPEDWVRLDTDYGKRKLVLVALQWGYSGELERNEGILRNGLWPDGFETLFEKTTETVFWGLRLHPLQMTQTEYQAHLRFVQKISQVFPNVGWEDFSRLPLPTVLSHSSALITMSSCSCNEASIMGVKSMAFCPTLREGGVYAHWLERLVANGDLTKAEFSVDSVLSWLESIEKNKPQSVMEDDPQWTRFCDEVLVQ